MMIKMVKSNLQVFVNIYDLVPTETFWEEVIDKVPPFDSYTKQELIDDIRANGLKYALRVNKDGGIQNGNMRYWVCRYLFEEEGDERFRFLPVETNHIAGISHVCTFSTITNELIDKHLTTIINSKKEVISSKKTFEEYEVHPDDSRKLVTFDTIKWTNYLVQPFTGFNLFNITFIHKTVTEEERIRDDRTGREPGARES